MNLVGKILTGIIAFFCIIFMTLVLAVYATHQNWKTLATDLQTKLGEETKKNDAYRDQLEKLAKDYAAERDLLVQTKASADTELQTVKTELDDQKTTNKKLETEKSTAIGVLQTAQDKAAKLQQAVDVLRDEIRKVQGEHKAKFEEVVAKTDQLHQAANTLASLKVQHTTLAQELARARQVLNRFGLKDAPELYAGTPPWPLNGYVTSNPGGDLVEVSIGEDDGLARGHRLEVFHGNAYRGRIEIVSLDKNRAVGKILPEYRKGIIQKDDHVTSQFPGVASK